MEGLIQELLGCQWGRTLASADKVLATAEDPTPCSERAVQIVVLHDGPSARSLKLCARHRDVVLSESTPHV